MTDKRSAPANIAVIDDDAAVRTATGLLLRSLGYHATVFETAEDFLASNEIDAVACVISDVRMPGMDGLSMQSCLEKSGVRVPVIFVTAFPDEAIKARAFAAGAYGYLPKPYREESLLACIHTALLA
jgi:FixJ family two-component response regulator